MTVNNQEILKEIDADFQYDYNKNAGLFMSFFSIGLSLFLLVLFSCFYHLKEVTSLIDLLVTMFFVLFSFYGLYESARSLKANGFIKKKYGNNLNKAIEDRINEVMQIEDIGKYYKTASDTFRNDILDPILEKEIKKKLGKNKYNSLEVLNKLKKDNKIEITNV